MSTSCFVRNPTATMHSVGMAVSFIVSGSTGRGSALARDPRANMPKGRISLRGDERPRLMTRLYR